MKLDAELFSPNPATRVAAAESLDKESRNQILESYQPGKVRDRGAANAWVVVVGPSYGAIKKGVDSSLWSASKSKLTLGQVHEDFIKLSQADLPFWKNLFQVLKVSFNETTKKLNTENLEHLETTLTTNLSPEHAGEEDDVPKEELLAGMSHFFNLLRLCKPRIVVALTKSVREIVLTYCDSEDLGKRLTDDQIHSLEAGGKHYHPKSCWISVEGCGRLLLTSLPQHPSKAHTIPSYASFVGDYLGCRFQEALDTSDSQLSLPTFSSEPSPQSYPEQCLDPGAGR